MVILQVALLAIVGAFGAGSVALGRASAGQHRCRFGRPADGALSREAVRRDRTRHRRIADERETTSATQRSCPSGQTPVCSNTPPRNNKVPSTATWQCNARTRKSRRASGDYSPRAASTRASRIASSRGRLPPTVFRTTSDTYIAWAALGANQRQVKQVSVARAFGDAAAPAGEGG